MVDIRDVRRMLNKCAPGHKIERKEHRLWVTYGSAKFRGLPKGGHGKNEIYSSCVRKLADALGIRECAETVLNPLSLRT